MKNYLYLRISCPSCREHIVFEGHACPSLCSIISKQWERSHLFTLSDSDAFSPNEWLIFVSFITAEYEILCAKIALFNGLYDLGHCTNNVVRLLLVHFMRGEEVRLEANWTSKQKPFHFSQIGMNWNLGCFIGKIFALFYFWVCCI